MGFRAVQGLAFGFRVYPVAAFQKRELRKAGASEVLKDTPFREAHKSLGVATMDFVHQPELGQCRLERSGLKV